MQLSRLVAAAAFAVLATPSAQAGTFKVSRTLAWPTAADFRGCAANTSHLNDRGEVAAGCDYQFVKFGLNPATLLFGFYGVQRSKLLFWGAAATSAKVVSNPSGHSNDSLWVSGLSNTGQALVYAGANANYMWGSAGWQQIKFSGEQQVRSLAPTGEVLGDVYGHNLEFWRNGVLTPWAIPAGYWYATGEAPNGPLVLSKDGDFEQLYTWRPGRTPELMPVPEGRRREYVSGVNASGQFALTTTNPAAVPGSSAAELDRRLHLYDGQRFVDMPDNGQGEFNLLKLSAGGQALVQQTLLASGTHEDWLYAGGQWTSLRRAVTLPTGVVYDQAITVNGLGQLLIQAKQGTRTVFLVCVPN